MRNFHFLAALLLLTAGNLLATTPPPPEPGLQWAKPSIEVEADQNTASVPFEFIGKNTGSTEIKIVDIQKSCGCTDLTISSYTIAPGQETKITGTIKLSPAGGKERKTVSVYTDDNVKKDLEVIITRPGVVSADTTDFYWNNGQDDEKIVTINIPKGNTAKIGKVESLSQAFTVRVIDQTAEATRIGVKPHKESKNMRGAARIEILNPEPFPLYIRLNTGEPPALPTLPPASSTVPQAQANPATKPAVKPAPAAPAPAKGLSASDKEIVKALVKAAAEAGNPETTKALLESALEKLN